jgi:hypothetical protein
MMKIPKIPKIPKIKPMKDWDVFDCIQAMLVTIIIGSVCCLFLSVIELVHAISEG